MPLTASSSPCDLNSSTSPWDSVPATPLNTKQLSSNPNDLRPVAASASVGTPSTVGSILVDPPNTATILNHTRIPVVHGRLCEGPRMGQLNATEVTTRSSRIPRGRHSLQLDTRTSLSETYSSSTTIKEPVKPSPAPACHGDALRSATNAVRRPSIPTAPPVSLRLDASFAPVHMRSAHRRSMSHGSNRPSSAYANTEPVAIGVAGVKGSKVDNGNKENVMGDTENAAGMHSSRNPKSRLPMTPSRERALLLAPSPASSSELSPLGQKMMADLRKQRQERNERRTNRFANVVHV